MSILKRVVGLSKTRSRKQILACLLLPALLSPASAQELPANQDLPAPAQTPQYPQQTPEQLQQLVAPIALYPDSLVAQILAASTFPEQVVEASRWVQAHPDLKGDALGHAVDQQPWDPSVKALTAFPSVLGNMDKNLSWTSSLGDAYYNQQPEVMDAVQVMRRRAQQAGNLKTTPQQTVETEGSTIVIQPAAPEVVYVPAYDPWVVYGEAIVAWPGWYPYPGIWYEGPYLWWGIGFETAWFASWGWGWGHWGCDWHHHWATYHHDRYYSHSRTFYNRNNSYRSGGERAGSFNRYGDTRDTRIRGIPRAERRKIRSLQWLRSRRRGKGLFLAWKLQHRRGRLRSWRRWFRWRWFRTWRRIRRWTWWRWPPIGEQLRCDKRNPENCTG